MIRKYLYSKRELLVYYGVTTALLMTFWALQTKQLMDTGYCLMLMSGVLVVLLAAGYMPIRRQYIALQEIMQAIAAFEQHLPEGTNAVERAYAEIAEGLQHRFRGEAASQQRAHNATNAYYTLWMHQIKTPIAALHLLTGNPDTPPALIRRELFEVERYVDMALQYIRSENMGADTVIALCDIERIVRESVKKYAPLFIGKNLSVHVEPLSIRAYTDEKWLAFLLEQILSNAAKYTKVGGVTISIQEGALVVADTGAGIRKEDLPRVFEQGYTGRNGRLDKRASGIGLYLCRRVADQLHIRLQIQSEWGKGTKVFLYFPDNPPLMGE